ncbi:glucose-6-phosphate dehydrogenase [Cordyceps fumosorosea ARSEF 2679]|uniref:Glucose-6-phosphate 1-dehydrogenase n=1 Tax=Cordyceps fumosorosea (strain ARSEF 2679) TaxID=1081104 RepID=A0A167WM30_CORFA|nr:glucose-6-phosphate dehydrogenase [Cordyceps fumosorosea ARSEF 2679]OAA63959.1 glucose-6-phosphate dehydrogenase [Cordyceps fumosorosea ARSEF 2679]
MEQTSPSAMELKENTTIVVLGASGDLAKKKTYPALFGLYRNQFLPKDVRIVGYARTKMDHEEYLRRIKSYMKTPTKEIEQQLEEFCKICSYVSGQYDKDESFVALTKHMEELEKGRPEHNRLFYMALPPSVFTIVSQHLKKCCYPTKGIARVIVEKPFGKDLASSRELQKSLEPDWKEEELYRIDHYLGKEMVKNILIMRFGNSFLGATWNRHHIDNVQITFKEPFGTEGRGGYFDEFGIIRDVMQNHLLQVLTLLAMERPVSFDSEDIRDEKVRVLRAISALEPKNVIIGQYGRSLDGSKPAYKEDDTVPQDSRCPTFCALVAYIKNERWDGVPFIMKAGKALNEQKTEIRIQFKDVTSGIFKDIPRNELVMRIQPNESVYIKMNSKLPGLSMQTVVTELDLTYRRRFSDLKIPEAYESLVLDCLKGDHSNFVRDDELDASWRIFTPLLHYLDDNKEIIPMEYPYGSRGPAVLDDFTASYGYKFSDAAGYQWPTTSAVPSNNNSSNKLRAAAGLSNGPASSKMENGEASGRTDHERPSDNAKVVADQPGMPPDDKAVVRAGDSGLPRMNDLPDEIVHVTQGFVPLSLFLTRLAQVSHNSLQDKVAELAKMAIPASALNGTATNLTASGPDDVSAENLRKKATLLHFAQDMHAKWVKALVITEWSRQAPLVSKLIDLKFHMDQLKVSYDMCIDKTANVKRDLSYARLPAPDLKTALQILSTGSAPWISDHNYIEPPPLTAEEKLRWLKDLNTRLSLRLNLEDYDKIPPQFRSYEISSGRVTFKVADEFEVDLTIADEDPDKQFWFIDFRYAFTPSALSLSEGLRRHMEIYVNDALARNGLTGCYQFLHEMVLTAKITELKSQALRLSRTSWHGTLVVEQLNRGLAIQYWSSRAPTTKSWLLIAVNSGKKNGKMDAGSPSNLVAKWYRDNQEVKDVQLAFDVGDLSVESLLKEVIGRHIGYILRNIRDKLLEAPRFKHHEAAMTLRISNKNPGDCILTMQVSRTNTTSLLVEPTTGIFAVKPQSKFSIQYEHQLNSGKNTADDGVTCLESVRCAIVEDELLRRGSAAGWQTQKSPLSLEETKSVTKLRDWTRTIWMRREGWGETWYVVIFLGLGGDQWWLLEANRDEPGRSIKFQARLPLSKGNPDFSNDFWSDLTIFATGMIAQAVDMRELHRLRIKSQTNDSMNPTLPHQLHLPSIQVALSALFPNLVHDAGHKSKDRQPWAIDVVTIRFKGIEANEGSLMCVSEAVLGVRRPSKFAALKGTVDGNLQYNAKLGEFCLRVQHGIGEPVLALLKSRIKAIDRFVNFLEAMDKSNGSIVSELVTLKEIRFRYSQANSNNKDDSQQWRITLDLSKDDIAIKIDRGNPHLRVVDLMHQLVNSDGGIGALMGWLPASLQALEAISSIEMRWDEPQSKQLGQVAFAMKSLSWLSLQYTMAARGPPGTKRVVLLQIRTETRRGESWWHVWRARDGIVSGKEDDVYEAALKTVWNGRGPGWLGLSTGAAARSEGGIVAMLLTVDEALRSAAVGESSTAAAMQIQNNSKEVVILD